MTDNTKHLGPSSSGKKKRGAIFIVIVASVAAHVLGLGALGVIKIVESISAPPEFEAPPVVEMTPPPPPPPPPPPTKRSQRSLPRPQPLAVQNPQNMAVPAIAMQESDVSFGRGMGGGLGELGGGIMDRVDISFFGLATGITDDVVFVIDMSGSMVMDKRGLKGFQKVVSELMTSLENMEAVGGSFNVIAFAGKAELFASNMRTVSDASIKDVEKWLLERDPSQIVKDKKITKKLTGGMFTGYKQNRHAGTRADLALKEAFRLRPKMIVFISDGAPTGVDESGVLKIVQKLQPNPNVPINTLSFKSTDGRDFLKKLALQSGGEYTEVK